MRLIALLVFGCARTPAPLDIPSEARDLAPVVTVAEPEEGWYNGACYAALDGDVDRALDHLARSIEQGEAPLVWMGDDPDLVTVRADPRYGDMRDAAIDRWLDAHPPASGDDWLQVAIARQVQGRDPTEALVAGEAAGAVHPVFGFPFEPVTPALEAVATRRREWLETHRGTVTVENPRAFELAKIVLSQTAYGQDSNATDRSTAYAAEVDAWFSPHRDHPLVTELDALPVDIDSYYAFRNQAAAWTLADGALTPSAVYPVGGFWGGTDPFATRIDLLEDFAAVTGADTFLDAHADLYAARIAEYEQTVPIAAMWDWLEDHFPAEGDGRDALVVRTSLLIGGSHNASTLQHGDFKLGTMVAPIYAQGERIEPEDIGPLSRMVFTEIDHHYVNPVSDRVRAEVDEAVADFRAFNNKADDSGYASPYLTFNEYATWVLFEVWWAEHCDAVGCTPEQREAGEQDPIEVMARRGFNRYPEFRDALVPQLVGQPNLEAMFPAMLQWFREAQ